MLAGRAGAREVSGLPGLTSLLHWARRPDQNYQQKSEQDNLHQAERGEIAYIHRWSSWARIAFIFASLIPSVTDAQVISACLLSMCHVDSYVPPVDINRPKSGRARDVLNLYPRKQALNVRLTNFSVKRCLRSRLCILVRSQRA